MSGPVSSLAEPLCGVCFLLHRLSKAAAALSERGNLLASMHWSLPRPTSKAEQQMSRHLEVRQKLARAVNRDCGAHLLHAYLLCSVLGLRSQ